MARRISFPVIFQDSETFFINASFFSISLPSFVTFSRAGPGTDNVNGELIDFATNVPRISTYNGYLTEESSTNYIRNGESGGSTLGVIGSGGAAPTNHTITLPAGITAEILQASIVKGFHYYDVKISGTGTGDVLILPEALNQITAASGNVWSASAYVGLIGGTLANVTSVGIRVQECALGLELTGTTTTFTPTIDPTRRQANRTFNNAGTTHAGMALIIPIVGAVDFTLRLSCFQLEPKTEMTSVIRTTSAAVTRALDVAYIPISSIPWNASYGTILMAGNLGRTYTGNSKYFFMASSQEDGKDRMDLFWSSSASGFQRAQWVQNYGINGVDATFAQITNPYTPFKLGYRYGPNDFHANVNGTTSTDTSCTVPVPAPTRIYLGQQSATAGNLNGYITELKISRLALSNAAIAAEVA